MINISVSLLIAVCLIFPFYTLSEESELIENANTFSPVVVSTEIKQQLAIIYKNHQKLKQVEFEFRDKDIPEKLATQLKENKKSHAKILHSIIKKIGWPTKNLVGTQESNTAFLIVDHADFNTQRELLPILHQQFRLGNLTGQQVAAINDRVLIKEGKPQRYGTQLAIVNGEIVFNEIESPDALDERRRSMNMMPMADYKRLLKRLYKLK